MKSCNKCKVNEARSGQYTCKKCHNEYQKVYYKNNPRSISESGKRRKVAIRDLVKKVKDVPCMDCGVKYPYYVMDLDHRPGEEKVFNLSTAGSKHMSLTTIQKEIDKCDVVCSNCHRGRTFNRIGR